VSGNTLSGNFSLSVPVDGGTETGTETFSCNRN
jgi:hypothetical protein